MTQTIKLLLLGNLLYFLQTDSGNLSITFNKTLNQGSLIVYIYNTSEGFPTQPKKAYRKISLDCKQLSVITVKQLLYKSYAIMAVHDLNSNGKMDRNWLGLPAEPYALSGHPKFRFGPPHFNDVKFIFKSNNQQIRLSFNK